MVLTTVVGVMGAAPASAAGASSLVDVTCPLGTQISTYQPGLTYTPRRTTFTAEGSLAPCVSLSHPEIVGAEFTAVGQGEASCTGADFSDVSIYRWNTGQTSRVEGRLTINLKPSGQTVLVRVGEVTSGLFEGATVTQTKVLPALNLLDCLTADGLQNDSGALSLTVAL
ncbi:hypothetical protein [Streptomyces sp. NPDC002644]